jgi:hypothetical protein
LGVRAGDLLRNQEVVIQGKGLFIWKEFSEFWPEYLELMAVLLAAYAVVRLAIGWERRALQKEASRMASTEQVSGIDASKLAGRVGQLRQDGHAGAMDKPVSFKKPLLVEERRREMEKLPFFQKPPPPEAPEHEDGTTLLFI